MSQTAVEIYLLKLKSILCHMQYDFLYIRRFELVKAPWPREDPLLNLGLLLFCTLLLSPFIQAVEF